LAILGKWKGTDMHPIKRTFIILLVILFLGGINPIMVQSASLSSSKPSDPSRLVVFEAFMNPA
jgi:hypothetical protein